MLDISTNPPAVPLGAALQSSDMEVLLQYAEATVRHISRRWYTNPYISRQMEMDDLSQMLRIVVLEKAIPKFDLSRHTELHESDLQRVFGYWVKSVLSSHLCDWTKRYSRTPERFMVDAPFDMSLPTHRINPDMSFADAFSDLASSAIDPQADPVVDQSGFNDILRKISESMSDIAFQITIMRMRGWKASEIGKHTGIEAAKVREILAKTIRPCVGKILELRTA